MDDETKKKIEAVIDREAPQLHNRIIDLLVKNGIHADFITASTLIYIGIVTQLQLGFPPEVIKTCTNRLVDNLEKEPVDLDTEEEEEKKESFN